MTSADSFTLRPATFDDLPELVELFNAHARDVGDVAEFSVEGYRPDWMHSGFAPEQDTRVAILANGEIAGLIEYWNQAPHVYHWLWGRVHPAQRGRGIGSALMDWAENQAPARCSRAPEGARIVAGVGAASNDQPSINLFQKRGYQLVRNSLIMERMLSGELPQPQLPGLVIRPMHPGEEAAVYRASREAFRDHWGHVEVPFEEGFRSRQEQNAANPNYDPTLWFIAFDGDEIAGVALCTAKTEDYAHGGWVDTLGVRRAWRRQGLGLALLYHSFQALRERGIERVGLSVDAQSLTGATRLYERAGMHAIRQRASFEKELRGGIDLSTHTVEA